MSDITNCLETGYICGLQTVEESFNNYIRHYDAFWLIEEASEKIDALEKECDKLGWKSKVIDILGKEACDELDKQMNAYFEQASKEINNGEDIFDF